MNKQFPTKEKTIFIVCEDVRQELGGKISLQGVFGGRIIMVENADQQPTDAQPMIPSLAFFACFHDGEGEYISELKLLDPDGNNILKDSDTKKTVVINDVGMNLIFKLSPFPMKIGKYRIVILLDGQEYSETFEIRKRVLAQ